MNPICDVCDKEVGSLYQGYEGVKGHRMCVKSIQDRVEWGWGSMQEIIVDDKRRMACFVETGVWEYATPVNLDTWAEAQVEVTRLEKLSKSLGYE